MGNENLLDRIKELLKYPDTKDQDWNPDKYWEMYTARKRKRQVWMWVSYANAAMLIFAVLYVLLPGNNLDFQNNTSKVTKGSPKASYKPTINNGQQKEYLGEKNNTTLNYSNKAVTKLRENTNATIKKSIAGKKHQAPHSEIFTAGQNLSMSNPESEKGPTLMQMWEQGKHERELRSLSITLNDRNNYNHFRLTINQQLLANKLNADVELHYHGIQQSNYDSSPN